LQADCAASYSAQRSCGDPCRVSFHSRECWSERCTPTSRPAQRTALRDAARRDTSPSSATMLVAVTGPMP
jgi:hypothetical protein